VQPPPCLLDRVVGLGDGSEHAVGDRTQMGTVLLELIGLPGVLRHGVHAFMTDAPAQT
jgi:hypothetical protein